MCARFLAQCFYLLATCQTDRCWTTLGLAVRVAQSIGLHVEDGHHPTYGGAVTPPEMFHRVWYSIFVLDRLVALQLGRPPGISDGGFNVRLPAEESTFDSPSSSGVKDTAPEVGWAGDYFLEMIQFSQIIGRVFDGLYGPRKGEGVSSILSKIDRVENELVEWKAALPRQLRFDLFHTFEKSVTFKRQVFIVPRP